MLGFADVLQRRETRRTAMKLGLVSAGLIFGRGGESTAATDISYDDWIRGAVAGLTVGRRRSINIKNGHGVCLLLRRLLEEEPSPFLHVSGRSSRLVWTSSDGVRLTVARQLLVPDMFGAKGDGAGSDDQALNILMSIAAKTNSDVIITAGIYKVRAPIQLRDARNITVTFDSKAWIYIGELIDSATFPHVINLLGCSDIMIIGAQVDGRGFRGANGIAFGGTPDRPNRRCLVRGGSFRRLYRSPISGGGRAVTMQFDCYDCVAEKFRVEECTTAADAHGSFARPVMGCVFRYFEARQCNEVISVCDLEDMQIAPMRRGATEVEFSNWRATNVGKADLEISADGASADVDGAVIVLDRARFPKIIGGYIYNAPNFGTIGSLIRGTSQGCIIADTAFRGDLNCAFDLRRAKTLRPIDMRKVDGVLTRWFGAERVRISGKIRAIANGGSRGVVKGLGLERSNLHKGAEGVDITISIDGDKISINDMNK